MSEAIALSLRNVREGRGGPFAALVVRGDEVIGRGTNQVVASNDPTAHAEMVAIRSACCVLRSFQLDGCEVFASCEPCPMCLGAIYWARAERLYFAATREDAAAVGFDDELIYREIRMPLATRTLATRQLMRDEAKRALEEWRLSATKAAY